MSPTASAGSAPGYRRGSRAGGRRRAARLGGPRCARGRPWWAIAGLAAIAVLALVLYTWALSRNGMANSYYAAAVKSATVSWKAFFFGSLDPGSFITVDKPPAAICGHGALRAPLRLLQLEHAHPAGPGRRGLGPGTSPSGAALAR